MERLTAKKKLSVVKLYLSGLSYDDIAARSGVSKMLLNILSYFANYPST